MMLRVSTQVSGDDVDLQGIVDGNAIETGIAAGKELIDFAETALGDDIDAISSAREAVKTSLGEAAMVDAAGVIANFQRMVRIADGTGIPLDEPVAMMTSEIREDLGINSYGSADNTPPVPLPKRIMAKLLSPFVPLMLKRMTREMVKQPD